MNLDSIKNFFKGKKIEPRRLTKAEREVVKKNIENYKRKFWIFLVIGIFIVTIAISSIVLITNTIGVDPSTCKIDSSFFECELLNLSIVGKIFSIVSCVVVLLFGLSFIIVGVGYKIQANRVSDNLYVQEMKEKEQKEHSLCPYCGSSIIDDKHRCKNCGADVSKK